VLRRVLVELRRPQTPAGLAARLGVEREVLEAMLASLERRGYAGLAYPESPTCGVSCRACSLKNLCPAAAASEAPQSPPVWRLTALGEQFVESAAEGG